MNYYFIGDLKTGRQKIEKLISMGYIMKDYIKGTVETLIYYTNASKEINFIKAKQFFEIVDISRFKELKLDNYNYKPFDKVIIRESNDGCWYPTLVSYQRTDGVFVINTNEIIPFENILPFEGNEKLIGEF